MEISRGRLKDLRGDLPVRVLFSEGGFGSSHNNTDFEARLDEIGALPGVSPKLAVAEPLVTGEDLPVSWAREADGELFIFFSQPLARDLTLPLRYGQSLMEAPLQRTVRIRSHGRTQNVKLNFDPYQSLLLKVDRRGEIEFIDIRFVPKMPRTSPLQSATGQPRAV